jgi:hypothetical protein
VNLHMGTPVVRACCHVATHGCNVLAEHLSPCRDAIATVKRLRTMCGSRIVWTDSWLSNAGAGSGLTSIGAGEEQVRKVVVGEASRCGEDK